VLGGAREAASAFLGRPVEHEVAVELPGRLERRGDDLWDGAHNLAGVEWLVERLPRRDYVVCGSILADKDVDAMLARLGAVGSTLIATRSSNPRALGEKELARRAEPYFEHVESNPDPVLALRRARELGPVLVTGSLYLLADLYQAEYNEA
jgi:folylpolyglutamate synthase/dihydropteroate synthase